MSTRRSHLHAIWLLQAQAISPLVELQLQQTLGLLCLAQAQALPLAQTQVSCTASSTSCRCRLTTPSSASMTSPDMCLCIARMLNDPTQQVVLPGIRHFVHSNLTQPCCVHRDHALFWWCSSFLRTHLWGWHFCARSQRLQPSQQPLPACPLLCCWLQSAAACTHRVWSYQHSRYCMQCFAPICKHMFVSLASNDNNNNNALRLMMS